MNADETRKKSLEAANEEIAKIKILIGEAVKLGKMHITLEEGYFLKEGTLKWLKENGYKYHCDEPSDMVDGRFYSGRAW